jgi:hypothetical protein
VGAIFSLSGIRETAKGNANVRGSNGEATGRKFGPPDGISPFAGLILEASVVDWVVD